MNRSKTQLWICVLLGLGTAILYWPITRHGFVGFDDNGYLIENRHIHSGVTWQSVAWAFRSGYMSNWHPLTWMSHMLDWQFYGSNPAGHHLTSLLIHAGNSVLLFLLLNQMTGARWRSGFVAALFAWHPLHVESVAWAAERKDVLSAFFWILTMMAYTRYARQKTGGGRARTVFLGYGLVLVLFALALMSKPMAVTLPFVLLIMDFWPLGRVAGFGKDALASVSDSRADLRGENLGKLILEKLPFLLLALAASIITFKVQQEAGAVRSLGQSGLSLRLGNAMIAYSQYILKTFRPADLAVLYPYPHHLAVGAAVAAALILVILSAFCLWTVKRSPYVLAGWLWFLGTLVPVIGIVRVGGQAMADRYTYIPSIGLFIAVVWGAVDILKKWPQAKNIFIGWGTILLAVCFALTRHQLAYWQDGERLFEHAIAVTTDNAVACTALSGSFDQDGKTNEALRYSTEAVAIDPHYVKGQYNLGSILLELGQTDEAIRHFKDALKDDPNFADAESNLGKAFQVEGKLDEAATHLAAATTLNPDDPEVHYNLGTLLLAQSKIAQAIAEFSEALRLMPDYADAHGNLAIALMQEGRRDEAVFHFAEKVRLKPTDPDARLNLGLALTEQNKPVEAAAQFSEVLRAHPESALAHYRLAIALTQEDKSQEAIFHCREALRLQPDFPDAREALKSWTHSAN